jgi:hypothetical protein
MRSGPCERLPANCGGADRTANMPQRTGNATYAVGCECRRFESVTRVNGAALAPGSNSAMRLHRLVLLLICLLTPFRSVGAAVIGVGLDVGAVQAGTHSTCIASVVSQHALEGTVGATPDDQQHGSNHHLDHTCASLCAMAAALPFVAGYRTEQTSPRLAGPTLSFQHFLTPPPHEPPRPTA